MLFSYFICFVFIFWLALALCLMCLAFLLIVCLNPSLLSSNFFQSFPAFKVLACLSFEVHNALLIFKMFWKVLKLYKSGSWGNYILWFNLNVIKDKGCYKRDSIYYLQRRFRMKIYVYCFFNVHNLCSWINFKINCFLIWSSCSSGAKESLQTKTIWC